MDEKQIDILIFFDESGKKQKPNLMGAVSIPNNIYKLPEFETLKSIIEGSEIHWKKYNGDHRETQAISQMIKTILKFQGFIKVNVINYDQSIIQEKSRHFTDIDKDIYESTIYKKFPERIIYGLIRHFGKLSDVNVEIIIEEATEYKNEHVNLKERLPEMLNIHSIYRGEHYKVVNSRYAPKKTEVGIELTDILLGMIRTILINPDFSGRKNTAKINLIMKLLKDPRFESLLSNIRYYEWTNSQKLTEIKFNDYLRLFMSKNYFVY
ncbi:DUF3800 domain-containing protein [Caldibacillus debilis]|jgi:hypothetical protein|uniref:DUF3800 domain-containing protein n=1 Tax=Caldibacillus debilis TaxID=301148 RepID=A0A150MFT0_9BACI|nr:DUF3800 domain-containing protein [Caldibacillus debilis]KYD23169.1 hypothetical protein B4135_0992 [Caldibacillus debilis]